MDYKIKYTNEAIAKLNKGFVWYRSKELDLSERFKSMFNKTCFQIKDNPKIFKEVSSNHRRAILSSSFHIPFII